MGWSLQGLAGPLEGQTFLLKTDITLGRQGDIAIADTKASSKHARIHADAEGNWFLQDNNSKNGTRVDGERISQVRLTSGLVFWIGDQSFEVLEIIDEPKASPTAPVPAEPDPAPTSKMRKVKRYWYDVLATFTHQQREHFHDAPTEVTPLSPALVLDFVRGVQADAKWILGYGPRQIGTKSLDLPLWEPGAPAVCFEIRPTREGILFHTDHPTMVRLNGEAVDSRLLRVGDNIRILETVIEVDFTE